MEKIFEIHDFSAKLQQKSVFSSLQNYYYNHTVLEASNSPNSIIELFSKTKKRFFSPLSINLDLTVGCNFRCPHCIDEDIINTKNKIDYNTLVKSLINLRIGGLQTVILIGGGEPTVYPEISNVVKVIKSLGMGCAIVTNGSRNHKILEIADYFDEKDWIRLSLDSGNDDTFQHLHKPVKKISLEDICESASKIKEKNNKLKMGFSFIVITPEALEYDNRLIPNYEEIKTAAILVHCEINSKTFIIFPKSRKNEKTACRIKPIG